MLQSWGVASRLHLAHSCVEDTGKEVLHRVLTISVESKKQRSCFSQGERSAIKLPLDCVFSGI